jgi:cytidylate kinase
MVTISSAYGSFGQEIGSRVADLLGFDLYDRELVEQIAANAHVRQKTVQSLDDRVRDWITEHVASQFENEVFTASDFLQHLSTVVLALGRHGEAVIVGRGAQFILDPEATLRVRTTAPLDTRFRTVARSEEIEILDARSLVLRKDAERAAFSRLHFNLAVGDPDLYDLIINTAGGPLERHADLISYAFLLKFGRKARAPRPGPGRHPR